MNYTKIKEQLYNSGYCDERKLVCHSYASYTKSDNYLAMMKFSSIKSDIILPQFHILSIKDDKLYISNAKMFGGFKKYYASIKLNRLHYKFSHLIDGIVMVHCFDLTDEQIPNAHFFVISIRNKNEAQNLVDAIKEYNNQN